MRGLGKKATAALLALALSVMMVPATAFATIGGNDYEVEVDATAQDASHTTGEDVAAADKLAVGVAADNGHAAEAIVGAVESNFGGQQAVLVEANNNATANVACGDITQNRGKQGVAVNASDGGKAVVETGSVSLPYNYYATNNTAVWATAIGAGSSVQVTAGDVTGAPRYGNGIDASTKGGNVEVTAGAVKAYEFGLNLDNAPPADQTADYTGSKTVTVDSVTQTHDTRYAAAGVNAFSYTDGDTSTVLVKGDVNAAGSRGLDVSATGGGTSRVTVGGTVNANYLGVKIVAGSLGSVAGTVVSTGTAVVQVGGVESQKWDKAVEIDSNTKGSTVTFKADGDVKALASDSTGVFARSDGGKSVIVVDGDLSGTTAGLYLYCTETGANDALVTGTISGKNGVDISHDSVTNDTLTVWKIDKGANGQYVSGENNYTPSDEREIFAKKQISYIVKVVGSASAEAANLRAAKNAGGAALDQSHGFEVAKEGAKVYLVVNAGYKIASVTNANECQVVQQDADGNYFIIVKRGGGIDLVAVLEGDELDDITVIPDAGSLVTGASLGGATVEAAKPEAPNRLPFLTPDGVLIEELKIEMDGQTPKLRATVSNTNDHDAAFDGKKLKVVKVADDEEVAFKTEAKELKAGETDVECEFAADANAMTAGDWAYVFYDGQLLGAFEVE